MSVLARMKARLAKLNAPGKGQNSEDRARSDELATWIAALESELPAKPSTPSRSRLRTGRDLMSEPSPVRLSALAGED